MPAARVDERVAAQAGPALLLTSPLDTPSLIAARCQVDLELGTYHFPEVAIPPGETAYSLLAKRCFRGVERFYRPVPPRALELLDHELAMIEQMGFAHYFLVVHDIVRWARARGIACSGRGSAGNSLVCHVLDITASEPIRHNLLFERFLNPNRREMPDIDVDFCSTRRDEVIDHIYDTFGDQNVAVVANVNTMSPRMAVRIAAEAVGFAPTEINALAKNVPRHGDAAKMRDYLAGEWPELAESPLQDESRYGPLLDLVERLDGFPIHLGTHLGGFVIADKPITYYAPLQWAAKGVAVIQLNKDDVADLGLVKMDILGLRTHSAVSETVHIIRQRTGRRIDPYALAPADPAAYEIISNGGSIGLFQLESAGQRNLATRLQERTFDDIIAAIALYRPGPLEAEMIGPFVDRRWGYEKVSLPHPSMAEALGDTYGVILYQEQVLRVAQLVAGFSPAEADSLRRAMTRDKSREEMAKIGATFVHHAVERGVPEEAAREVFRQLEGFAAYGFNKSHSVCFAVISYATAYLKAHYPAEFLCAVQNNQPMGFYTPRTVLNDARRFGLEVRPLDINLSGRGFTVEDETPPDPWAHGDPVAAYDPFAIAWTAAHDWGLTPEDRAQLEALHGQGGTGEPTQAGRSSFLLKDEALSAPAPTPPVPGDPPPGNGGHATPAAGDGHHPGDAPPTAGDPHPGDLPLPHAERGRARAGVAPDACLAPAGALAPGAGRALRVGLRYLKQMSERALRAIEEERRYAPFSSFEDFYLRTRVERPVAENLIRVGAFDSLEPDRTELLWRLPILHDRREALAAGGGGNRGQLRAFFAQPERSGLTRDWSVEDKVRVELELLGPHRHLPPLGTLRRAARGAGRHPQLRPARSGRRGAGDRGRRLRAGSEPLDALRPPHHVPHPGRRLRPLRVRGLREQAGPLRAGGGPGHLLPHPRPPAEQPQAGTGHRGGGDPRPGGRAGGYGTAGSGGGGGAGGRRGRRHRPGGRDHRGRRCGRTHGRRRRRRQPHVRPTPGSPGSDRRAAHSGRTQDVGRGEEAGPSRAPTRGLRPRHRRRTQAAARRGYGGYPQEGGVSGFDISYAASGFLTLRTAKGASCAAVSSIQARNASCPWASVR